MNVDEIASLMDKAVEKILYKRFKQENDYRDKIKNASDEKIEEILSKSLKDIPEKDLCGFTQLQLDVYMEAISRGLRTS